MKSKVWIMLVGVIFMLSSTACMPKRPNEGPIPPPGGTWAPMPTVKTQDCVPPYVQAEFHFRQFDDDPAAVSGILTADVLLADGRLARIRDKTTQQETPFAVIRQITDDPVWIICIEVGAVPEAVEVRFGVTITSQTSADLVSYIIGECTDDDPTYALDADREFWETNGALIRISMTCQIGVRPGGPR